MGQYFTAVYGDKDFIDKPTGIMVPDSLKLCEFAYLEEPSMQEIASRLINAPQRFVVMGDYGNTREPISRSLNHDNLAVVHQAAWGEKRKAKLRPKNVKRIGAFPIIVNHTRHEYIDIDEYRKLVDDYENETLGFQKYTPEEERDIREFVIDFKFHPLAILTAHGNAGNGGDYVGNNDEYAGLWAWDVIELTAEPPADYHRLDLVFSRLLYGEKLRLTRIGNGIVMF